MIEELDRTEEEDEETKSERGYHHSEEEGHKKNTHEATQSKKSGDLKKQSFQVPESRHLKCK